MFISAMKFIWQAEPGLHIKDQSAIAFRSDRKCTLKRGADMQNLPSVTPGPGMNS